MLVEGEKAVSKIVEVIIIFSFNCERFHTSLKIKQHGKAGNLKHLNKSYAYDVEK